jgi:hypothetical protein
MLSRFANFQLPENEGNLSEILARVSAIPVRQAANGREIANQMPRVIPRSVTSPGLHMPINHFIRSLAQECGRRAIGIILSGAGTDGAAGLDAMRGAGGVTFAQNPATEKIDSMPPGGYCDTAWRPDPPWTDSSPLPRWSLCSSRRPGPGPPYFALAERLTLDKAQTPLKVVSEGQRYIDACRRKRLRSLDGGAQDHVMLLDLPASLLSRARRRSTQATQPAGNLSVFSVAGVKAYVPR